MEYAKLQKRWQLTKTQAPSPNHVALQLAAHEIEHNMRMLKTKLVGSEAIRNAVIFASFEPKPQIQQMPRSTYNCNQN